MCVSKPRLEELNNNNNNNNNNKNKDKTDGQRLGSSWSFWDKRARRLVCL
jgi:hypothetical protein